MKVSAKLGSCDLSRAIAKAKGMERAVTTGVTLAAREDCKPYVPYLDGHLRGTAETESVPEDGLLVWGNASVPYARAQHYGLPNKRWPGTCMQWFDPAKAANISKWIRIAGTKAGGVANGR